jgi:hypothetical protein
MTPPRGDHNSYYDRLRVVVSNQSRSARRAQCHVSRFGWTSLGGYHRLISFDALNGPTGTPSLAAALTQRPAAGAAGDQLPIRLANARTPPPRSASMAGGVHKSREWSRGFGESTDWRVHLVDRAPERFEPLVRDKSDTLLVTTKEATERGGVALAASSVAGLPTIQPSRINDHGCRRTAGT